MQDCLAFKNISFAYLKLNSYSLSCLAAQLYLTLCDPMDCSPPESSVHGILQARILEWVAFPPPGGLPNPGIEPASPALQVDSLPLSHQGSPRCFVSCVLSVQFSHSLCPTLRPHEPQHARPPCPSPTPRVHPNPCPSSQ